MALIGKMDPNGIVPFGARSTTKKDFEECDTCKAKPGMPVLCKGCQHNRELIARQKRLIDELFRNLEIVDERRIYAEQFLPGAKS